MAWPVKPKPGALPVKKPALKKKAPTPKAALPMHKQVAAQMLDPDVGNY